MRRLLHLLPASIRLFLRVGQRRFADLLRGRYGQMAGKGKGGNNMPIAISLQQAITGGDAAANKIQNLHIGIDQLQGMVLQPGQLFSFWQLIGQPSIKKGYQKSRSIVQGQLVAETGGGLCQLSGLIYLLALNAGLRIIERHAHSMDIYREAERFAPLGGDATVSYGYKDLRFVNNLPHPIGLQFAIANQVLQGSICSTVPITVCAIEFNYVWQQATVTVTTLSNDTAISTNSYTSLYPHQANTKAGTVDN